MNQNNFDESNVSLAFHFFSLRVLMPYGIFNNLWSVIYGIGYFSLHPMIQIVCLLQSLEVVLAIATIIGFKRSKPYAFYAIIIYFWCSALLTISTAAFYSTSVQGFALNINARSYIFRAIILWGIAIAITQYYLARKFIFVKKVERYVYHVDMPEVKLSAKETEQLVSKRLGSLDGSPPDNTREPVTPAGEPLREASPWD